MAIVPCHQGEWCEGGGHLDLVIIVSRRHFHWRKDGEYITTIVCHHGHGLKMKSEFWFKKYEDKTILDIACKSTKRKTVLHLKSTVQLKTLV